MPTNGTARLGLTVAGVLAAIGVIFSAGITYARLTIHVEDEDIHQGVTEKHQMIDKRTDERLGPRLEAIERQLMTMNQKLDSLRQNQIDNHPNGRN